VVYYRDISMSFFDSGFFMEELPPAWNPDFKVKTISIFLNIHRDTQIFV
jgi:hypothetical protein